MHKWIVLEHNEKKIWNKYPITHVCICRGVVADTEPAKQMMKHIRQRANADGIAAIKDIETGFPALRERSLPHHEAMLIDLRHMANERTSGRNSSNKGLLKLGWVVPDEQKLK